MLGVVIGRFQPLHNGHLSLIREALSGSDRVAIVLGSHNAARNLRNPFTTRERREMIANAMTSDENSRVQFLEVRDYFYQSEFWINEVREKVRTSQGGNGKIRLFGYAKDATNAYLSWFPDWEVVGVTEAAALNATTIRDDYFRQSGSVETLATLPSSTKDWLRSFSKTSPYENLAQERRAIDDYKKSWSKAPFPPVFVTTDCLIVQAGHILLIRRAKAPGKGLLALPGGFLDQDETLESCALRELQEETCFSVGRAEMLKSLVSVQAFDHPLRSSRGRTITHVHYFKLSGNLATFQSGDDAAEAHWVPVLELSKLEEEFFEDHFHIINRFLRSY
jgi:bifunctional NMN adenylyltransferase/nudix hydrolase